MRKLRISAFTLLLAAGAGGCAVGPNYSKPEIKVPPAFGEANYSGAAEKPDELVGWWTTFNDPVLNSLVEKAVKSNLDLRLAESRIKEVRALRGATDSDRWPQLSASGSYSNNRGSENTFLGKRGGTGGVEYDLFQAGFDASWEIDLFGGVKRAVEAADADISASVENRRDVLVTLLGDVARNYIELRGLQRQIAITNDNIKSEQETLELIRLKYKAGMNSYLDVVRAESLVATTKSQMPSLERSVKQSTHRLSVLLGQEPGALGEELSKDAPVPVSSSKVVAGLPSDLLLRRPDIRKAERELSAASARIGVAKADLFPRFSLTGSFGLQSAESQDLGAASSRFWSVGPSVRWPLFTAGRTRANIRVQDARHEQALTLYEQTILTALEDVENALVAYSREQARMDYLAEAAAANRQAVSMAVELYSKGLIDFLNVLEAERSLYASESQLSQSEAAVSSNLVALYKALGGGWERF